MPDKHARPDWMRPRGRPWTRGPGATVFDNPWIRLETYDQAVAPTGAPAHYGLIRFKHLAVGVLPLFDDGTVILVGQHRFPAADYSWEVPEGGGRLDEAPEAAARRELLEETGLQAAALTEVLRFQLSNSVTDEHGVLYVATGLSRAAPAEDTDPTEDIAMVRVPFREALDQAKTGGILDMMSLALLLRAYQMAVDGELPADLCRSLLS